MTPIQTDAETEGSATKPSDSQREEGKAGNCCGGAHGHSRGQGHGGRHGHGHGWMMIACCVPMLLIAVILLTGGAGLASIAPAILCVTMMGLMMLGMSRMHGR